MNNRLLLLMLVLFCLVPIVTATVEVSNIHAYWNMNADISDYKGTYGGTNSGGTFVPGMVGNGIDLENSQNDYFLTPAASLVANNGTIAYWYYVESCATPDYLVFVDMRRSSSDGMILYHKCDDNDEFQYKTNVQGDRLYSTSPLSDGEWYHLAVGWNDTGKYMWINGRLNASSANTIILNQATVFSWSRLAEAGTRGLDGIMDEMVAFDQTINTEDAKKLYDCGIAGTNIIECLTPSVAPIINVNLIKPQNNTQYNIVSLNEDYGLDFNFTTNVTSNCSLYQNGVLNQTLNELAAGSTHTFKINYSTTTERDYNYSIRCFEFNNTLTNGSTVNHSVYVDLVNPTITSSFDNTVLIKGSGNLTGTFTLADTYIYSYNVSLQGVNIDSATNMGISIFNYNLSYGVTDLNGTVKIRLADGHTAAEISEYDRSVKDKELTFDFGNYDIKIYPADKDKYDWVKTTKLKDRYNFEFNIRDGYFPSFYETFVIESEEEVVIAKNSKYPGHIIIGNQWVDFATDYDNEVTLKRISKNKVEASILNPSRNIKFNSIGDLNEINMTYYWYTANVTAISTTQVIESDAKYYSLSFLFAEGTINNISATFDYDGTTYNPTPTITSTTYVFNQSIGFPLQTTLNLTHYSSWNYTITDNSNVSTTYNTSNITITSYQIAVDNCSTYDIRAINLSVLNISDGARISGADINGFFTVWYNNFSAARTFNLSWSNQNDAAIFGLCIHPNWTTYNMDSIIEYEHTDYVTGTYYHDDAVLNNITETLNFYTRPADETSLITFEVTDQDDNPLSGALLHILEVDITTGATTLVSIIITDSNGHAFANLFLNTQWYEFLLYYPSKVLVFDSNPTKIISTTQYIQVNLLGNIFDDYDFADNVYCPDVAFNNDTNTFSWSFSDPTGNVNQGCLRVTKRTSYGDTEINTSCVTAASGSISYSINESVGTNLYIGTGIIINTDGTEYICGNPYSNSFDERYKDFGDEGIFMSFLIIVVLVMIGLWNPAVAIILAIIGFVVSSLLGIFSIGWGALVTIVILGAVTMYRVNKT